jgi:2-furoyl-CoA dehydrogenase large subunit
MTSGSTTSTVLLALAARKAGRPIKWVESRLEHLVAATSATNRLTTLSAAVDKGGMVTALAWDQLEDCGAYLRAPEPATLYRMHGNMTGAYRVRHLTIRNRVVLTNKTPSGLVRGFGGPQVYFALERLMQRIAMTLGLDPLEVIRRNLVETFPYRCPAGAVLDSGDYRTAVDVAARGGLAELRRRRDLARAEGRCREQKLARCRQLLAMQQPEPPDNHAAGDYRDQYQELTGASLTECPVCQRGHMVIIEVLKPAKPCRPIHDTS